MVQCFLALSKVSLADFSDCTIVPLYQTQKWISFWISILWILLESIVPLYHCTRQMMLMSLSDFSDCTIVPLYHRKCQSLCQILAIVPLYHCTGRKSWCLCQIFSDCTIVPLYRSKMLVSLADFSDCTIVPNSKMTKFLNFKTLDSARKHCTIVPLYQTGNVDVSLRF